MTDQQRITRRAFLGAAGAGATLLPGCGAVSKPNIVYVMSDQQHWNAVGYRDSFFDTPVQDALAGDSHVFDNFFCSTPQCSPSRSSMFTGLYPTSNGVMGNIGAAGGAELQMETFAPALQRAGYTTGYFGKWHLGATEIGNAGWDEEARKQKDPATSEMAVDFIERQAGGEKPFALIASYLDPHDIYSFKRDIEDLTSFSGTLPDSWVGENLDAKPAVQKQFMTEDQGTVIWGSDSKLWEWYHEFYRRKVKLFDNHLGRVVQALKDSGAWENTVLVVSSDHGDMDTNHRLIYKGPFMYEHMVRIPLLIRVPEPIGGAAASRVTGYQGANVDLAPTILDFAGVDPPAGHGESLKPMLTGTGNAPQRDYVIGQYYSKQKWVNPIRMIRTPEFKFNRYILHGEELYDLKNDPDELVNVAADAGYATRRKELADELDEWIAEHNDPFYSQRPTDRDGAPL